MEFLIFILKQLITIPFHFTTLLSETLSCWRLVVQSCRIPKVKNFKMLGLNFSSKLDRGSYIISIAKITSKKIGALICSTKFLSPKVALYLYKSTICPCMEYCCQVLAGACRCYLELLDKPQKQICRTVGPTLAAFLEPLAHC